MDMIWIGFVNIRFHVFSAVHTYKKQNWFEYGFAQKIHQIDLTSSRPDTGPLNKHLIQQYASKHITIWQSITEQTEWLWRWRTRRQGFKVLLQMHFSSPLSASRSHCWRGNLRHWIYIQDHVICLEEAECSRTAPWIPSESHWSLQTNQKGVVNTILKWISSPICSERPCEMFYYYYDHTVESGSLEALMRYSVA